MILSNLPGAHRDATTEYTPPNPRLAPLFCMARAKICTVCGDDLRLGILFGQDNERGIAGVHRGILEHQFLRAGEIFGPRAQKSDGSIAEQAEQGLNGLGVASQIRTGFAKHINGPPSTIVRTSIALACGEVRGTAEHRAIRCCQGGEVHIAIKLPSQHTPD